MQERFRHGSLSRRMNWSTGKYVCALLLVIGVMASPAFSAKTGEFELTDGSVVRGEIVSVEGGTYRIRTESLGEIRLDESKIKSIRVGNASAASSGKKGTGPFENEQVKVLKDRLAADPDIMSLVTELQGDPAIQEVLKDPQVMNAILSNDVSALTSNPKLKQLLDNPKIKEITRRMEQ
jgi:hypothetical protein